MIFIKPEGKQVELRFERASACFMQPNNFVSYCLAAYCTRTSLALLYNFEKVLQGRMMGNTRWLMTGFNG